MNLNKNKSKKQKKNVTYFRYFNFRKSKTNMAFFRIKD